MQKTFDAITHKDKRKKPALTDIPDNISHNPIAIPEKTNRKANKVFGDQYSMLLFALNVLQRNDSDTRPKFLVPPGTEPRLVGSRPIPHQSVSEESCFGFHAPVSLANVNINLPSATDGELSDHGSIPIDPTLRTPMREEFADVGNDNISKWSSSEIHIYVINMLFYSPGIDEQSPNEDEHMAHVVLQKTTGSK